jgi:nucleoside-diphosphate-sugar epimerase
MRVFIAGATGVLGRSLIRQLVARGHEAVGLARSAERDELLRTLGAESRRADLFDPESVARAADGAEAVVHAATAIPLKMRSGLADWALNDRIRREGTQALTEAAAMVGARVYIQQSVVWVARPPDGQDFDEAAPIQPHPILMSAVDGELFALEAGARHGFASAVLRYGAFYGAESGHTRAMGEGLARGRLPIVGRGNALLAAIHVDDAAGAAVAALEAGRGGLWHVVDDRPVPAADLLREFAARLGVQPPRHIPVWLARLLTGSYTTEMFTLATRTSNQRIRRDLGWSPAYPTIREGLDQVVGAWRAEGFLVGSSRPGRLSRSAGMARS